MRSGRAPNGGRSFTGYWKTASGICSGRAAGATASGPGCRDEGRLGRQREDTLFAGGAHAARATGRGLVMNEVILEPAQRALEERSRALFLESVEGLDMRTRSRLNRARQAAVAAADSPRGWFLRRPVLSSAGGVAAAAAAGGSLL